MTARERWAGNRRGHPGCRARDGRRHGLRPAPALWPAITARIANLIHHVEADAGSDTTAGTERATPLSHSLSARSVTSAKSQHAGGLIVGLIHLRFFAFIDIQINASTYVNKLMRCPNVPMHNRTRSKHRRITKRGKHRADSSSARHGDVNRHARGGCGCRPASTNTAYADPNWAPIIACESGGIPSRRIGGL